MKRNCLIIGFWCVCFTFAVAQQTTAEMEINGTWKVLGGKIDMPPAPDQAIEEQLAVFKDMFLHSHFEFQGDHNFNFNIAIAELNIQKGHWKYNANNNRYEIQEWADKDNNDGLLMNIELIKEGAKTFFVIPTDDELPKEFSIKLEVVKLL